MWAVFNQQSAGQLQGMQFYYLCLALYCMLWLFNFREDQIFVDFVGFLSTIIYDVLYTQCLRHNICSAWFIDIRISTCCSSDQSLLLFNSKNFALNVTGFAKTHHIRTLVLGDIKKIKTVQYCHKIP